MPIIKVFCPLLPLNFKFGHTEIIVEYYWNEIFIVFVDCS